MLKFKRTSVEAWLVTYHILKTYHPTIKSWTPNFDENIYAIAWSNPIYKGWEIYTQPFYNAEPHMDIQLFNPVCSDKPLLVRAISSELLLNQYLTEKKSVHELVTIFLTSLSNNIVDIEKQIQQNEYEIYQQNHYGY